MRRSPRHSRLVHLDPEVLAIVWLSFQVSLGAVVLGALACLPLGAWIAVAEFPGRGAVTVLLNGMMGMPPVVLGVVVYLALSRSGPWVTWACSTRPAPW